MSNPYYDHTTYPASGASGSSAALRAELDAIEAGFDKLPVLSGNALKLVRVNAGATALEASDAAASGVACTPSGNLASTNVQAALVELQGDIDTLSGGSLDADLTAIAALTGTGFAKRIGTNTWSLSSAVALGSEVSGTLGVGNGGTGQTTFTNGQLLIGNTTGNTLTKATLTAGTGISITNGTGSITITNTGLLEVEGAAVTAAATTDIWASDGNTRHVTGNTTITSFGTAPQAGARMKLIFDGTPQLTQGANLNLNAGGANITIEAGDWAEVYADTTAQLDVVVHRKSGQSVIAAGVPAGTIITYGGNSLPSGYLDCDGAAVSRTTYAALFSAIGTLWGAGDGSTTFNVPNIAAGYSLVENGGTIGANTTGEVKAHTHTQTGITRSGSAGTGFADGSSATFLNGVQTASTGGSANLAAGVYVMMCIKY